MGGLALSPEGRLAVGVVTFLPVTVPALTPGVWGPPSSEMRDIPTDRSPRPVCFLLLEVWLLRQDWVEFQSQPGNKAREANPGEREGDSHLLPVSAGERANQSCLSLLPSWNPHLSQSPTGKGQA